MTLILLLVALLVPSFVHAQAGPNEPSGMTQMFRCVFNHVTCSGQLLDAYNASGTLASPPTAGTLTQVTDGTSGMASPSGASRSSLFAGRNNGGSQLHYITPGGAAYREMYVRMRWRMNADFYGRQVANKMWFMRGPASNGFFGAMGGPGGGNAAGSPFFIFFGHNSGNVNNGHTCGGDALGLTCFPNVGTGQVVPAGDYFDLEAYMKSSTSNTARDGIVKWWVNNSPAGNYTNMNLASLGLNEWVWSETWDGTVNPVPAQDWHHFIDDLYISMKCTGTCVPATGDTTPPSQVTGVATTSISATSASLAWSIASDNVAVTGYQVERCAGVSCTNFSNQVMTSTPSITLSGLVTNTPHSVRVKAFDAAGNVSASYSATLTFTTLSTALPSMTLVDADATGADVAWSGSPSSIRVVSDTVNVVEPMSAFPVLSDTITRVQKRTVTGSGTSISLAYSSTNTAGNFLALRYAGGPGSVTISNCSDTRGNTWTAVPNATGGAGGHQAIRYAKNIAAGANTVNCTLTGAASFSLLDIFEYSGVDQTSPLGQSKITTQVDPGTGTDAISSGNVTTVNSGELILGATLQVGQTIYSASAGFSGTQGTNGWYYKDSGGSDLTWNGSYWFGSASLGLWQTGGHPGFPLDAVRRWVAPSDGAIRITGTALNSSGCGGTSDGTNLYIKKNGTTLWSQLVPGTGSFPFDVETTVVSTDQIDFVMNTNGTQACDSTEFNPTITLGTASGSGGTTTAAGTGFTLLEASYSDSPSEEKIQTSAGVIAATFTGADASNDYITSIATFRPASTSIRYSRQWPIGSTFVCMFARDALGNENVDPDDYQCDTVTATPDVTPPVLSTLSPSGSLASGTTTATLSLHTNEVSTCRYDTSSGTAYASMTEVFVGEQTALFHIAPLTGLTDGSSYTYYVRCSDFFGNVNLTDTEITFEVNSVASDTDPPTAVTGLVGLPVSATQLLFAWDVATDDVAVTGYEVHCTQTTADYGLVGTSTGTTTTISGLAHNTLFLCKVRAFDAVGNFGDFSDPVAAQTLFDDVTLPSDVEGLTVSAGDFQSLNVSWTAGTDDVGVHSTGIERCQGSTCTDFLLVATVLNGTSTTFSGLFPNTTYRFRAKHADAAGNVSLNYSTVAIGTTGSVPVGTVTAVCPCKHHR